MSSQLCLECLARYRENGSSGMPLIRSGSAVEDRQLVDATGWSYSEASLDKLAM